MTYDGIAEAAVEPRVENPHFSTPETFHNAMSFRSYDNHGLGKSISSLLDTFSENDSIKQEYLLDRDYDMGNGAGGLGLRTSNKFDSFYNSKESPNASKTFSERRSDFLRNTPPDFPMIVREAMDKQNGRRNKFAPARRQIPRQNAVWHVVEDDANGISGSSNHTLPPPANDEAMSAPETPLIENAPESIDFISAASKSPRKEETSTEATDTINVNDNDMVLETPSSDINLNLENVSNKNMNVNESKLRSSNFLNNIDAIQLDDAEMSDDLFMSELSRSIENMHVVDDQLLPPPECNDINSNLDAKPKTDKEDDDEVFREYNSHQYWYISPDVAVDTDILLDPEEKSKYQIHICMYSN